MTPGSFSSGGHPTLCQWCLKSQGKRSCWVRGQIVMQIIRLNTLVDVIRVPEARTSGE